MWVTKNEQEVHYHSARKGVKEVSVSQIVGVCQKCKCVELRPSGDLEAHNGGLMVPRKGLLIKNERGTPIQKIRNTKTRKINQYWGCNYCVNKW